jgi:hypothetical protein
MEASVRELVRQRANGTCEYCRLSQNDVPLLTFHVEHIIPRKHGGSDDLSNLALACQHCNLHKGPNLTGIDPASGEIVALYHPRRDRWDEHFAVRDGMVVGLTAVGRTTVRVLEMDAPDQLDLRFELD